MEETNSKKSLDLDSKQYKHTDNTSYNMVIIDDDDDENESKKKRYSVSPIQSVEETIFWLKNYANSNSNDYLLNKNCEIILTGINFLHFSWLI